MKKNIVLLFILISSLAVSKVSVQSVSAQFLGSVYISEEGSVVGTNSIQRSGNTYTLTANISGGIQVQKSLIVIDGAGYSLQGNGEGIGVDLSNGRGQDPSHTQINNVTVKNLQIINFNHGIGNENTDNNTFIGNYVVDCDTGFWITGSGNNILLHNTVKDCVTGISINYAGANVIVENNIINNNLLVWLSAEPTVDRNYWSDYLTRYPNATEVDSTGVGDTPYVFASIQNGTAPINYQDDHPLMKPLSAPSSFSPAPSTSPTSSPSIPEIPSWTILTLLAVAVLLAVTAIKRRKHSKKTLIFSRIFSSTKNKKELVAYWGSQCLGCSLIASFAFASFLRICVLPMS